MNSFAALTVAQWRGFIRDRQALFWTIAFPLMFLILFGGIFTNSGAPKMKVVEVGAVQLFESMPPDAKAAFDDTFEVEHSDDLGAALEEVKQGDVDAAVVQDGDSIALHFSQADQVKAAMVQGTMESFVQGANQALSQSPPRFTLVTEQVEDDSLKSIQYVTPGLLGWAVAMGATFGAAMTLVQWRSTKLLRRLRLSPVRTDALIGARTLISIVIAIMQSLIFIGLAVAFFGLQLSGSWWMAFPLVACGTLAFMSIGLLAGAFSKTSEGASGFANLIVLPMAFLSGSFIPLDAAPDWLQTVALFLPLGHLNEGMLDVMVRGQGPAAALAPMGILLGFALVIGLIAARVFRWEED